MSWISTSPSATVITFDQLGEHGAPSVMRQGRQVGPKLGGGPLEVRHPRPVRDPRPDLDELQTRFERVMQDVRQLPGGDWLYQRVDAYPGIRLDRDMGAGKDADGWLAEVAAFLEGDDPAD
jgi:hypothetical protein